MVPSARRDGAGSAPVDHACLQFSWEKELFSEWKRLLVRATSRRPVLRIESGGLRRRLCHGMSSKDVGSRRARGYQHVLAAQAPVRRGRRAEWPAWCGTRTGGGTEFREREGRKPAKCKWHVHSNKQRPGSRRARPRGQRPQTLSPSRALRLHVWASDFETDTKLKGECERERATLVRVIG